MRTIDKVMVTIGTLYYAVLLALPVLALVFFVAAGNSAIRLAKEGENLSPLERMELEQAAVKAREECLENKALSRERLRLVDYLTCS